DGQTQKSLPRKLFPQVLAVADGVVLELADDLRGRVLLQQAADRLSQHLLLFGEVQVHPQGLQSSPWIRHGLSSSSTGTRTRAVHSVTSSSPTVNATSRSAHPSETSVTVPLKARRSPGQTGRRILNF